MVFWLGPGQQLFQRVIEVVAELYAVWVSVY